MLFFVLNLLTYLNQILSVNRLYKCGSCSFESLSRNELENHIIGVHPAVVEPTLFQCPLCDRHFKLKYKAIKHREVLHTAIQQVRILLVLFDQGNIKRIKHFSLKDFVKSRNYLWIKTVQFFLKILLIVNMISAKY